LKDSGICGLDAGMPAETHIHVRQKGNRVEIHGLPELIHYDVAGIDLPPLTDHSFAIWHVVPILMRRGGRLVVDGPVDPVVIENAERIARAWELWEPAKYRAVEVTASELKAEASSGPDLLLFSGGVDATHMLLSIGRQKIPAFALTMGKRDYPDPAKFAALLEMTDPLLAELNYRRIVLKTNASDFPKGRHQYAMELAGAAFLLSGVVGRSFFAADCTWEQDMLISPWGLNHVTNRYLRGSHFETRALYDDVSRAGKVDEISRSIAALNSVSFCKRKEARPRNCGTCSKCLRTKLMFVATGHAIPDIFIDRTFDAAKFIRKIDTSNRVERAFMVDAYQYARDLGVLASLPGIEDKIRRRENTLLSWFTRRLSG
jgi:hypothetical protein